MNTLFLLMAEYNAAVLPLSLVAKKYLGLDERMASRKACAQSLPLPAFRMCESQKSPWLVKTEDLAKYLDQSHEQAVKDWKAINMG